MNLVTIAEHTVCLDLLPERANVLDLGCRGFLFANELRRLGHNVYPVDCANLDTDKAYIRKAFTNYSGTADVFGNNDPQGINIKKGDKIINSVEAITLESFCQLVDIEFWDIIKFDIEGSEYEVIMSLIRPPAKQLSIEFHLHTGIYGIRQMAEMHDKLRDLGYTAVQHEMTKQHGLSLNFWDSLFILQ